MGLSKQSMMYSAMARPADRQHLEKLGQSLKSLKRVSMLFSLRKVLGEQRRRGVGHLTRPLSDPGRAFRRPFGSFSRGPHHTAHRKMAAQGGASAIFGTPGPHKHPLWEVPVPLVAEPPFDASRRKVPRRRPALPSQVATGLRAASRRRSMAFFPPSFLG